MSRPYAEVIGDPIAHSKSPLIHNFWLEKLGIDAEYRACHVRPDELGDYFARRREDADWRGCNVTIPHKEKVSGYLDMVDERAAAVGAINTIYRNQPGGLIGTNTDVDGVAASIGKIAASGCEVCIIGAGGAARAAFRYLAGKPCSVGILARNPEKALCAARECGLFAAVAEFAPGSTALHGAGVLVNVTQLGMSGAEPMPGFVLDELDQLSDDSLVFDMVYAPLETELLKAARARKLATSDGLVMLVGQAATAFERFFGVPPPRQHDEQLRRILTS